ncbi:hypothetical protein PAJ34TS1_58230 [Paenibacillus azoreducens]|uniref:IS110 family transposase n=1 Tax=Paenibacillus azoreducens TaxID=116718 RepID=A0A920CWD3_9BACL|nr:hypothetical protein J34TS1_62120 [Paenibacillus azoreducens]
MSTARGSLRLVATASPREALSAYVDLRRALYLAVQCGLRKGVNERLKSYYEKKRKEGKPYKVVVIACANKLLHHVYAILVKGEPYKA